MRQPFSKKSHKADDKSNVGSHGYAPTLSSRSSTKDKGVYNSRHNHAPQCRCHRQSCRFKSFKFTINNFSFNFKTHNEKENGHQGITDPVPKRIAELKGAN